LKLNGREGKVEHNESRASAAIRGSSSTHVFVLGRAFRSIAVRKTE
jgi:hypothetical protein